MDIDLSEGPEQREIKPRCQARHTHPYSTESPEQAGKIKDAHFLVPGTRSAPVQLPVPTLPPAPPAMSD